MLELNIDDCYAVGGASHEYAEACLAGGGVGGFIGSFASPFGSAVGGLVGCGGGVIIHYLLNRN